MALPKLTLRGSPREIGFQHGHSLRPQILSQLEIYTEMFEHTSKMSWSSVLELAEEFRATCQSVVPDLYAEMQGIADGAGLNELDILALNCRSEIALGSFRDGCTSLSWRKNDKSRVLTQNWDWTNLVKGNLAMVNIERAGKPGVYMVTEAGIVGKIGFNTAGVGTCLNAIRAKPCDSSKLPIHLALRVCLESTSVENALQTLSSLGGVASAQHILIADSKTALGLELSPLGDVHLKEDEFGMVTHTNHFLENRYMNENPWQPGSSLRLERIRQIARGLAQDGIEGEKITPVLLRERIFSDMENAPSSICAQEDLSVHRTVRSCSLFNIVMNLDGSNSSGEVVMVQPGVGMEDSVVRIPWV